MKTSIEIAFDAARSQGGCAFLPFLTAGYPDVPTCIDLLRAVAENGADVIEVGLPFSDPLADGPTIQQSSQIALENGVTPFTVFDIIEKSGKTINTPIVIMTYCNPIFRIGAREFASRASQAGTAGVILADLPPEEADEWLEAADNFNLATIFLVAPTTPYERVKLVASKSSGFLYYVSMTGVTGSGSVFSNGILEGVRQARELSSIPVAVGFGVSTPQHARMLAKESDGVIVGSALIREIDKKDSPKDQIDAVSRLVNSLSSAVKSPF